MKKVFAFVSTLVGLFVVAGLVKRGTDTYKENHKSRGAKLIDSMNPKHRK